MLLTLDITAVINSSSFLFWKFLDGNSMKAIVLICWCVGGQVLDAGCVGGQVHLA